MYCLRLFVLQELHCSLQHLLKLLWCVPIKRVCIPSFILSVCCVSGIKAIYVSIVMYGLRLFIVVYKNYIVCQIVCILV